MSAPSCTHQVVHRKDHDTPEEGIPSDSRPFQSESERDQIPQGEPGFIGGSRPLFDMYLKMAVEEDRKMVDGWKADALTTLFFSGLFSVVVAAFLVVSFRDLRPDPQDKPTFYLENIYQLLADPNGTRVPTSTQSNPLAFSPPRSAVWVNSLWSLSLVMALSCALLAILVQQWARRYVKTTQRHSTSSAHKRARIRAIFHKGVEELHLQWTIDALSILLHASLVLFLAGFIIFSLGHNHTVLKVVASWVGLCAVMYACFTLFPLFRHESPYYTPLSPLLWLLYTGTLYVVVLTLRWFTTFNCCSDDTWIHFGHLKYRYGRRFSRGIEEAAEEYVQKFSSEIDSHILLWALQSLDEGHEVQRFFETIHDIRNSQVLDEFRGAFETSNGEKMTDVLIGLMDRTLSYDLITQTKEGRIKNYIAAMAELSLPINQRTLERVLYKDWDGLLDSVEFGLFLRNARYSDPFTEYYSECVVSVITTRVKERDDRWFELVTGQLDVSKPILESYLAHGDSILLANCIFICRRTLDAYSEHRWPRDIYSRSKTLELVSRFDVQDVLPELQHKFCDMWNELVRNTGDRRSRNRNLSIYILKHIRDVYFELHRDTIAAATAFTDKTLDDDIILLFPSSYPSCEISHHHPNACSAKVEVVCVKRSEASAKGPSPNGAPPIPQDLSTVSMPVHTPPVVPANSGIQCLPPGFPSPKSFSMIQGDVRTHATSFGPSVTFHSTNTTLSPLSNPLSRIRDHGTNVVSNATLNATTQAQAVYTSSTPPRPRIVSRPTAVSEPGTPLATHDALSMLTSNTGHTSTIFASMQSVDDMTAVLPQPISTVPPARTVVRISHVKDDPRLPEPPDDMTVDALVSASPRDGADPRIVPTHAVLLDTPSPSLPIQVPRNAVPANSLTSSVSWSDHIPSGTRSPPTNNSTTALLQRQQSLAVPLVLATTPDLSQPLRGTISFPEDTDGSGRSRTHPADLPT